MQLFQNDQYLLILIVTPLRIPNMLYNQTNSMPRLIEVQKQGIQSNNVWLILDWAIIYLLFTHSKDNFAFIIKEQCKIDDFCLFSLCLPNLLIIYWMRNQNKLYNVQNNQNPRKYISPNQLKANSPTDLLKNNKNQEYRASERETVNSKNKEIEAQSKLQKNKSQSSNETNSVRSSNTQKSQPQQPKQTRTSSKSKQRKDYMAANLSRFNRKKQEKPSSSNTSQRSNNAKEQKQPRYIYTFKEQINNKQKVNAEYAANPSAINQNSKLDEEYSEKSSSQFQASKVESNNSSIAVTSKGKALEVNVVKYEDRNRRPSKEIFKEEVKPTPKVTPKQAPKQPPTIEPPLVITQTESSLVIPPPPSQKRLPLNKATRIQLQSNNQYQAKFSQQLMAKLRNQRQQFSSRLYHLQAQKQKYQQSNTHLIQQKYQIQAQLTIALNTVAQLQHEVSNLRDIAFRNNKEVQRTNNNNQRMFKQLQQRYNSLLQQYRNKIKQNAELSLSVNEQTIKLEQYKNSLRSAEEEIKNRGLEVDKVRRIYEARMNELKQEHDFQMKQFQIKSSDKNKKESNLEEILKQLQREIQAKNMELQTRSKEIDHLQLQLRDKDELSDLYNAKCTQNVHLFDQLNENKQIIYQINQQNSEIIQKTVIESKEKDKRIKELQNTISNMKNKGQMQKLSTQAHHQLFTIAPQGNQSQNSFQQLIKSQSQQTNKLRSEIVSKQEQLHRLSIDNDQLKERVRRLEQQVQLNARTYAMNLSNINQMKEATQMMLKKRIATLQAVRNVH